MSIADHISGPVAEEGTVLHLAPPQASAPRRDSLRVAAVAPVSGVIDEATADELAHELIDLVFAMPPTDVVLDFRSVHAICPACVKTLRNARLAMDDQGVELRVRCPAGLVETLAPSGVVLEVDEMY